MVARNILPYRELRPRISHDAYVDPQALVIGDVIIEEEASVWPGAIIRADEDTVTIEREACVLDRAFIEAPKGHSVVVEEGAIISHGAILHGCEVGERALVGIGAIVLEDVKVGDHAIIGAGAVVPPGTEIAAKTLVMGAPAKKVRAAKPDDLRDVQRALKVLRKKAKVYQRFHAEYYEPRVYIH